MKKLVGKIAFNALAINAFWIVVERVFQIVIGVFVSGLLARHFGVALFGQWQYALTLVMLAMSLTWICGAEVVVPQLSRTSDEKCGAILGTALLIRVINSVLVSALYYLVVLNCVESSQIRVLLIGLGITIIFREPSMLVFAWLQSRTFVRPAMVINIISLLAKALLIFYLIKTQAPLYAFALAWAAEMLLVALLLSFYFSKQRIILSLDKSKVFEYLKFGFYIWIGFLAMYGLLRIDRVVLESFVDSEKYGYYAAASQLNENWLALGVMLVQSVGPRLIYMDQSTTKLKSTIAKTVLATIIGSLLGSVLMIVLSPVIIDTVFGSVYGESLPILQKIVWLSILLNVEVVLNIVMLKYGLGRWIAFKWLGGLFVAALSCFILVPDKSVIGAIASVYLGLVFVMVVSLILVYFRIKNNFI